MSIRRFLALFLSCLFALIMTTCTPATAHLDKTEILWDTWGVPHIFAKDTPSLFYAFGWSQIHNHGNLILRLYAQSRGRAAEYLGEKYIDSDRQVRTLGISQLGQQWYDQQSPDFQQYIDEFARGMNDYAQQHPQEINNSLHAVLPITGNDVFAHIIRVLNFTFIPEAAGIRTQLKNWQQLGSNAWAISPQKSANHAAMLLANPHLPWSDEFLFFEAQFVAPEVDAYGATLVGSPLLTFAFNDDLGWTHTVNTINAANLYELTLTPEGTYQWEGGFKEFTATKETLKVKQLNGSFREESLVILNSIQGAVIARKDNQALALRVAGLEQSGIVEQYWQMLKAKNLDQFESALKRLQIPMFTVIYADKTGHILHVFNGQIPIRTEQQPQGVLAGNTAQTLWTQTYNYADLPKVLDPQSGWLQNANDPPWTTTFPPALNPSDYPAGIAPKFMHLRAQRSAKLLQGDDKISLEAMIRYKHSTRSELADRVLDDLLPVAKRKSELSRRAAEVLERWDRETNRDSKGAVLFNFWVERMNFPSAFKHNWDENSPLTTPNGLANVNQAVTILEAVASQVETLYGTLDIPWGEVFRMRYGNVDLPANGGSETLGIFRVLEFEPAENNKFQVSFGDSYIAAIAFSEPLQAKVLNCYGNASQVGSIHVGDQLQLMAKQELRDVWRDRKIIEAHLESRDVF